MLVSNTPTVTPRPIAAFIPELIPEGAISCWSVRDLLENVDGSTADVAEAVTEVDCGAIVVVADAKFEIGRVFVDRISEELLVKVAI